MLPPDTRLGVVRLQVGDLARSIAFYDLVLGFRVQAQQAGRATLGGAGGRALLELVERPGARRPPRSGRLGLFHVAYLLPERASLGRLLAHLSSLGVPLGMSDHLVSEALYMSDPDGLGIEVYADRPRDAWSRRGGELEMATEPLDAAGLMAAAGEAPWAGAPPGTVVGHVHLHVGDLDVAARFYGAGLGFEPTVSSYPGALFLSAGGYHHHLGLNTWASGAPPAAEDDARLLDWEVLVPGPAAVEAAAASLDSAGFEVHREGGALAAADPWGTVVRVAPA